MASLARCATAAAFFGLLSAVAYAESGVDVSVNIARSGESLQVAVLNRGSAPIRVPSDSLPWGSPFRGFRIVVVPLDPRAEPLGLVAHWDEPIEAPLVTLEPGEPRIGDIDLGSWFTAFAPAHSKSELLVFWSWLPGGMPQPQKRLGGWLLLPKASNGVR